MGLNENPNGATSCDLVEFDKQVEEYVAETLGWELDLLKVEQKAEETMADAD